MRRFPIRFHLLTLLVSSALLAAGCQHTTVIGALGGCRGDGDCAPPDKVCSADGQCVPGCVQNPGACLGAQCDPATGQCEGKGVLGRPCSSDGDCGAPDFICKAAGMICVAGCGLDPGACWGGYICDFTTGHCCDPSRPDCHAPPDGSAGCDADDDCAAHPGTICQLGVCIASCVTVGCIAPKVCGANGHCALAGACTHDEDCDPGSYCDAAGACTVLPVGGKSACEGGTVVRTTCNQLGTPAAFRACVGAAGPATCPYCTDGSCYHPGLCVVVSDCHRGDACSGGLCHPSAPPCPSVESAASVVGGSFAAGREVCVRDVVKSSSVAFNGDVYIRLGSARLSATLTPLFLAGTARPSEGATITMRGVVRWDDWYTRWELAPALWWQ